MLGLEAKAQKRILVIGINCLPELTGIGRYTGELVSWLAEKENLCSVITSFPYYPYWKVQKPYSGNFYQKEVFKNGKLEFYRCPLYVPAKPNGLKRVIHEFSFFMSAFFVVIRLLFKKKYDEIICIAPPFHLCFLALFYRFFKGGRLTYHIQDLQIEAARNLKVLKPAAIFKVLFAMEHFLLNKSDVVSTISTGMLRKVQLKTQKTVMLFPNWVDTTTFYPVEDRNGLKTKWGFTTEQKIVLYSGSIGEKQGLEALIEIAVWLRDWGMIQLVICGTGPYKQRLEEMKTEKRLSNLHFFPLQDSHLLNNFLNMADVHLILQKSDASDLVMPSKLTTILAVGGLAIVTADDETSLYELVTEHKMGVVIPPEKDELLGRAIYDCCMNGYDTERQNARLYAEQYLDKKNILDKFTNTFGS